MVMMRMFHGRDFHASRGQLPNKLTDQCGLAGIFSTDDVNASHTNGITNKCGKNLDFQSQHSHQSDGVTAFHHTIAKFVVKRHLSVGDRILKVLIESLI